MTRSERIQVALTAAFAPVHLKVIDESAMHAGHSGAAPGGETHYQVVIEAAYFTAMGRVARSRAVHDVLAAEFTGGMHALALKLRAPGESP